MTDELRDGLNDCSNATYHADRKYLSSSVLKTIYKNIADYKDQYIDGNKKQFGNENSLSEGSLTHAILLEEHNVKHDFVFYEGLRKAGAEFEAFKAALKPDDKRIIISKPQKLRVESYIRAFKRRPEAVEMLQGGFAEQTICGALHGVPIKVRFDYINVEKGIIYDVKTTADPADLECFKETIKRYSYQLSAALYLVMAEQYYNKPFKFKFIVISKQEPQVCEIFRLSDKTRAYGDKMVRVACEKYKQALATGNWTEPEPETSSDPVLVYEILEV